MLQKTELIEFWIACPRFTVPYPDGVPWSE